MLNRRNSTRAEVKGKTKRLGSSEDFRLFSFSGMRLSHVQNEGWANSTLLMPGVVLPLQHGCPEQTSLINHSISIFSTKLALDSSQYNPHSLSRVKAKEETLSISPVANDF